MRAASVLSHEIHQAGSGQLIPALQGGRVTARERQGEATMDLDGRSDFGDGRAAECRHRSKEEERDEGIGCERGPQEEAALQRLLESPRSFCPEFDHDIPPHTIPLRKRHTEPGALALTGHDFDAACWEWRRSGDHNGVTRVAATRRSLGI